MPPCFTPWGRAMSEHNPVDKEQEKSAFINALRKFIDNEGDKVKTQDGEWAVKGFLDVSGTVYTISTDTKVVSKILEIQLIPKLMEFAENSGFEIVLAEHQNYYPDLSFVKNGNTDIKFAVDFKTTYRNAKNPNVCNGFTLGSHGEYFTDRQSKKNVQFPYGEYTGHLCLGIIYSRSTSAESDETKTFQLECPGDTATEGDETTPAPPECPGSTVSGSEETKTIGLKNLDSVPSVIRDIQFFVQEKWKIASDKRGSGNTANIGSIKSINDIIAGNGVFADLGENWFDDYWINYGKITIKNQDQKEVRITNISDFQKFRNGSTSQADPKAPRLM